MRIIHYCPRIDFADGGVVRAVLDVCTLLAEDGHEVVLLSHDDRDAPQSWRDGTAERVRSVCLEPPNRPMGLYGRASLERAAPQIVDADVLHLHTPWATPNLQFAARARRAGTPYVLTVHGMLDDWCMAQRGMKKRLYLALCGRRLLEDAAFVHCTAQAEADQARKWFPRGRTRVIPLVFDLEPFRELPDPALADTLLPQGDAPIVLFLSRLHYKKGPDVLVEAAALLRERGRAFRLVFVGTGDEPYVRKLETLVDERGLRDCTTFTGLVVGDRKLAAYQRADVFALPTSQENFGIVFPEALACGTPLITTRGVDIWPELEASGGAIIAGGTAGEFADAIEGLLADPQRRAAMGRSGREWVLSTFHGQRILAEYVSMYREAAGG